MKKIEKITLAFVAATLVLWGVFIATINNSVLLPLLFIAIAFTIVSVSMGCMCLAGRIKEKVSPYLIFGIINAVIALGIVAYSLYDIYNDVGMMAGIRGFLLLVYVTPIPVLLIIIDVIVYFVKRKKNK